MNQETDQKLLWQKYLTREYTFLYIAYAFEAYKIMKKIVGATIAYDLAIGRGKLVTLYGINKDFQNCYKMIEKIALSDPKKIVRMMDEYDKIVKKNYELFAKIKLAKEKKEIQNLLLELDKTFLTTLCYYLFFVYLGYGGDLPGIRSFLKKHGKRFANLRLYTIDLDMNRMFPKLFARFDRKLQKKVSFMSPRELRNFLVGYGVNFNRINKRKKRYLFIMKAGGIAEFSDSQIDSVLIKELSHLQNDRKIDFIHGRVANKGNVRGTARLIFSALDYKKIKNGDIIVTPMTKPDIEPYLRKVKGIITNDGGALSHASIISREMNIPCIVGTVYATDIFRNGDILELNTKHAIVNKIKGSMLKKYH